ncbi:lactadherin [Nematostella vectensis]|nr:lactadherin [Nematostella vectensis]
MRIADCIILAIFCVAKVPKALSSVPPCRMLRRNDCIPNMSLNTSERIVAKEVPTQREDSCMTECYHEALCMSYNEGPVSDDGLTLPCELNAVDHVVEDKLVPRAGYRYCSFMNPCISNPCQEGYNCKPDFNKDDTYSCIKGCGFTAVGLHDSHIIPDSSFTASSFLNVNRFAHFARLNGQHYWVPSSAWIAHGAWLQVDLLSKHTICAVATQGGTDPTYNTWITQYKLSLSTDGASWEVYQENGADKVFPGNKDKPTVVKNFLSNKPSARYVRFLPIAWADYAGGRVEVYGTR